MKITFTFPGPPVPAARPRVTRSGHAFTPKAYDDYKKALAHALFTEYGYFAWDFPPPGSKDRSKWLKANRYKLTVRVYQATNRGDIDNFCKGVQDALQQAGIVADDSQVDSIEASKQVDKQNPRIEIELESLK